MEKKIMALTSFNFDSWYRRLIKILGARGIEMVCLNKVPETLRLLKDDRFNLVLVDSDVEDLENVCFKLSWGCRLPTAIIASNTQHDLSKLRYIGIDSVLLRTMPEEKLINNIVDLCHRRRPHFPTVKILVIEDDKTTRDAIKMCFRVFWPEAKVDMASSGKEGIDFFHYRTPDLIMLDLGLPDLSGFEVLDYIRSYADTPVVMLTGDHNRDSVIRAIHNGVDDYIIKPYKPMELLPRIKKLANQIGLVEDSQIVKVRI